MNTTKDTPPLDSTDLSNGLASMHDMQINQVYANPKNGRTGDIAAMMRDTPLHLYTENDKRITAELTAEQLVAAGVKPGNCGLIISSYSPASPDRVRNAPISFVSQFFNVNADGKAARGLMEGVNSLNVHFNMEAEAEFQKLHRIMTSGSNRHALSVMVVNDSNNCGQLARQFGQ